ncbi:hypothetical protein [Streptosporangium carneum]|uniref:Uncharacterized protein n=1 Tax=Streptosporangium carneum TaxID=47481 RepID=A0A9W6MBU1_9ACTN|nr:hypothetical protein [Streptosporangium carneum]GLK08412.1 hypothetical protein GCM10017600_18170 [Streptosporangium carneum]
MTREIEDRLRDAFASGVDQHIRAEPLPPARRTLRAIEETPPPAGRALHAVRKILRAVGEPLPPAGRILRAVGNAPRAAGESILSIPRAAHDWYEEQHEFIQMALFFVVFSSFIGASILSMKLFVNPWMNSLFGIHSGPGFVLVGDNHGVTLRNAQKGEIVDRVELPPVSQGSARGTVDHLLAGNGDGRVFYVAQRVTFGQREASVTSFHLVELYGERNRTHTTSGEIPTVTGAAVSSLALSGDGSHLAYSLNGSPPAYGFDGEACDRNETQGFCPVARLVVVDLSTKSTRSWAVDGAERIDNLSWTADHRTLGFTVKSEVRVLDTTAEGDTPVVGRTVARKEGVIAATISPDGRRMLVGRTRESGGDNPHALIIDEYSVADGVRTRTLITSMKIYGEPVPHWSLLRVDSTGDHLLFMSNRYPLSRLDNDLRENEVTPLLSPNASDPGFLNFVSPPMSATW